jgi:hypothetical protein
MKKISLILVPILLLASFVSFSWLSKPRGYLTFSDSAKFADAARSFNKGLGLVTNHSFFDESILKFHLDDNGWKLSSYPITPLLYSLLFRLFGESDKILIIFGGLLFVLAGFVTHCLSEKIFGNKVSLISIFLFSFNPFLLEYAYNATSEIVLIFLFVLTGYIFVSNEKKQLLTIIPLSLTIFTRQQGILIFAALLLFLLNELWRKYGHVSFFVVITFFTIIYLVLINTICKYDTCAYSPSRILGPIWQSSSVAPGVFLRGAVDSVPRLTPIGLTSKIFYNFYNFLKSPDRLVPGLVLGFSIIGMYCCYSRDSKNSHRLLYLTISNLFLFVLAASATLPNARYIHPILPFILIFSALGIVKTINNRYVVLILTILLIFPTLGDIYVDYRFKNKILNYDRPPIYKLISDKVSAEINSSSLIVTNMDAWMSWYGKLKTMWFPLSPNQLQGYNPEYLVLTSYNTDDGDFSLGEWKDILVNPKVPSNKFLLENYELKSDIRLGSNGVFENRDVKIVILKLKK